MTETRTLDPDQYRAAQDLFRAGLHDPPSTDDGWPVVAPSFEAGRVFGAFLDGEFVGTALSFAMRMEVPGGARLPTAGVTRVAVRVDRTRRGALKALMLAQLRDLADRGDVLATLRATSHRIYGRFGYGVATRGRDVEVAGHSAGWRPGAPVGGDVTLLPAGELRAALPELHDRIGWGRPGATARPGHWWDVVLDVAPRTSGEHLVAAVHAGADGPDGYVVWSPRRESGSEEGSLVVHDLWAAGPRAYAGLWRLLLRVDLVTRVRAPLRPLDEPLELMVDDPRRVRTTAVHDEVWLRLVDVPAALRARSYAAAEPVVLEVTDALLPANGGRYRIGPDGAERTDAPAQLGLDVGELAVLYLGDRRASELALAGRIAVHDAAAPARADALLRVSGAPWSGTQF